MNRLAVLLRQLVALVKRIYRKVDDWGEIEKARKNKHIVRNALVATLAVGAIGFSLWNISQDLRAQDALAQQRATEAVAQDLYEADLRERKACIDSIATRDLFRKRFFASADSKQRLAEILDTAVPDEAPSQLLVDEFYLVVAEEFLGIEEDLPRRKIEDCPPIPTKPVITIPST